MAGALLKEARIRAGLSQAELGQRVGLPASAISRWERGKVGLSFDRLSQLVQACGLELDIALRPADDSQASLIRANLGLTPEQRLERLTRQGGRTAAIQGRQGSYEPVPMLEALVQGGVDFVVVGATAAALHGSPYPTDNLDIALRAGQRNRKRLAEALRALGATSDSDSQHVETHQTPHGTLHVIADPVAVRDYASLARRAPLMSIGDSKVRVATLADVVRAADVLARPGRRAEVGALRRLAAAA